MKVSKKIALTMLQRLMAHYPNAVIELNYEKSDPWQLLVVVALSAQSTDKKVNEISPNLFKAFPTIQDFAKSSAKNIEPLIKTLGLFRNKAKNLHLAAQQILQNFNGKVPKKRSDLESIAGVGKKTAAVIVANAFNEPAIAVDTHVARLAKRMGLSEEPNPHKIELDLMKIWPKELWLSAHHTLIFHGRRLCFAKKPKCQECPINALCPKILT